MLQINKSVSLGTSGIKNNDVVYFGIYNKTYGEDGNQTTAYNVPWYVVNLNTTNKTAFMLSRYCLEDVEFRKDKDNEENKTYGYYATITDGTVNDSDLKKKMDSLSDTLFTAKEKAEIVPTDIACNIAWDKKDITVKNAYLFPLSDDEASVLSKSLKFSSDIDDPDEKESYWWLRSSWSEKSADCWLWGGLNFVNPSSVLGVRPAFNLNLGSVLFTTLNSKNYGTVGSEWKLTLLDESITVAQTEGAAITRSGNTVTVPYTIGGTGSATQVSVLLLDSEYGTAGAKVLAYQTLDTAQFSQTGTGTFTIPSELSYKVCGSDYYAYIVAEDANGAYETDYASNLSAINIISAVAPPAADVEAGTYTENKTVALTSATTGATIYYTTDGTDPSFDISGNPTAATKKYTAAIQLPATQGTSTTTAIKAVAVKSGSLNSSVSAFEYTITLPHVHGFEGAGWQSDTTKHWRVCTAANCDKSEGYTEEAAHTPSDWITDKAATAKEGGSRHKECTVCAAVLERQEIAKLNAATASGASPLTGDDSGISAWVIISAASFAGLAMLAVLKKRRG